MMLLKIAAFVVATIASRLIFRRAALMLSEEQRELVSQNSTSISLLRNILLYGAAISMLVISRIAPEMFDKAQLIALIILTAGMSVVVYLSVRTFNKLGLPVKSRNLYVWSVAVQMTGVAFLLLPVGNEFGENYGD